MAVGPEKEAEQTSDEKLEQPMSDEEVVVASTAAQAWVEETRGTYANG